jgi:tRNA-specific 2-thiouridylase
MPHYVLNFTEYFKERVIDHFVESYSHGETPNPCIECNRSIKFETLLLRTAQLDFDYLVTGHYARIQKKGRFLLKKAVDSNKDQSYVLYMMTQQQLASTYFPLGTLKKPEVRDIAAAQGFVTAHKHDSQDICFVPDGNYADFIETYTGIRASPGDLLDDQGNVVGKHRGLIRYTIGQRRGIGYGFNEPRYVYAKDPVQNTVSIGPESTLYTQSLVADRFNLIACETLDQPIRVMVKTRYRQEEQPACMEQIAEDRIRIRFDQPQRAITTGQAAVCYDGDIVIGGGTICAVERL